MYGHVDHQKRTRIPTGHVKHMFAPALPSANLAARERTRDARPNTHVPTRTPFPRPTPLWSPLRGPGQLIREGRPCQAGQKGRGVAAWSGRSVRVWRAHLGAGGHERAELGTEDEPWPLIWSVKTWQGK